MEDKEVLLEGALLDMEASADEDVADPAEFGGTFCRGVAADRRGVRAFSARLLKLLEYDLVVEEEADLRGRCNARAQKDEAQSLMQWNLLPGRGILKSVCCEWPPAKLVTHQQRAPRI